ncbi:tRNA (N6-isopentenyl adenosine(37)-C2)-methylthiotransferase MiaB [Parvularcula sp. LCG005]|uniref:tRNA (N6-isopentenyl adenosine(37)-C2)-methylthiotransferase MiaB n=1 Tax=Parvularcula sp. LCG005 TaxID=3078805 RepID=UPI00294297DA|nr:tRNA (N6-isopentenyl adenosine(37)-C2)-methylthiotransferase MiaB [Parvularcula sp. LCG005]WOI53351.1 tRNA (N6-isopentenyl adenosine(37)-C2)-methylthiotransferase MiaB [Parvularcula sp. LCG005]
MSENTTTTAVKRVFVKTWGCQMNVYDSERMTGLLKPLGYAPTDVVDDADLVILNTCHIREKAAEKVYSELGRLKPLKEERGMQIAVAGCVAQAEGAEITARAPQVDIVFGPQSYHKLPEMIARAARDKGEVLETHFDVEEKFDALAAHREADGYTAFVTVQEGCDKFCTFCVVPYTRGAEVSRHVDMITAEVRQLAAQGVREITLLGQNVNAWQSPAPAGTSGDAWGLGQLCRHLARVDGIDRIRFTTSHPRDMDDELIAAFGEEEKLMPYLHLPVQAGSDRILKAMNRGHTAESYIRTIEIIRAARPDIAISGDMIVGFPGEDDAAFEDTMALVREINYASCFSFKYSRRPGTPGATMAKQVAEDVKNERLQRLQALLEDQKQAFNAAQVGRTLPVLFEKHGRQAGQLIGRSPYLQSVFAVGDPALLGQIVDVRIDGTMTNSLAGSLARDAA